MSTESITLAPFHEGAKAWMVCDRRFGRQVELGQVLKHGKTLFFYPPPKDFGLTATELRQIADRMDHAEDTR